MVTNKPKPKPKDPRSTVYQQYKLQEKRDAGIRTGAEARLAVKQYQAQKARKIQERENTKRRYKK